MVKLDWSNKKIDEPLEAKSDFNFKDLQEDIIFNSPLLNMRESFSAKHSESFNKRLKELQNGDFQENLLIHGENRKILNFLMRKFRGKIKLIYIDPPFATGSDFNYKIFIGEKKGLKNVTAYSDIWKEGTESYLNFIYERLLLMKKLLSNEGSIYVHLDWHISHYIKIIMDEIFGIKNFRNEVIWAYPAASARTRKFFIRSFDAILFYTKTSDYTFNDDPNIYMEYSNRVKNALKTDENGTFYYRGGSHDGKKLSRKVYIKNTGIFPRDVWNDIPYIRANTKEYQGFSTQKPERLLRRIILASTDKDDIVADFFCGSGSTLATAEKLGRRWIGCDIAKHSVHMTHKRLLNIHGSRDVFETKENYNKKCRVFRILSFENKREKSRIPKEILLKNYQDREDKIPIENLCFNIEIGNQEGKVTIKLKDFSTPLSHYVTEDINRYIIEPTDWIDFWSINLFVDNMRSFNLWNSFRMPKERLLKLMAGPFEIDFLSNFKVQVKVTDILGYEISKILEF